ncbi:hypothetical protein OG589_17135 [Sphaerisporangium sp. NBC_01403]|uniref:hypothetical protein n=1 Tax=Sphaerisporangium sp. NBC_01403 TaxID=2903599 RepID=UPI003251CC0C
MVAHGLEELALDLPVTALIERGLLKAGGKQRTDSTHVISADGVRMTDQGLVRDRS